MTTLNNSAADIYYNLSGLASDEVVTNTGMWLANFNAQGGGIIVPGIIIAIGVFIFITLRFITKNDTQSWSYAGTVCTFISFLLFIIETGSYPKLVSWQFFLIVIIVTALGLFLHTINRDY